MLSHEVRASNIFGDRLVLYYRYDKLHRVDGPAAISSHTGNRWFQYGQRHRVGNPAVMTKNGYNINYVRDKYVKKPNDITL